MLDSDEHWRILTPDEEPNPPRPNGRQHHPRTATPFTTAAGSARLEATTKGRIRCRKGYGGPEGYADASLAPGPSPSQQPERRQMTHQP
jgi:hypothetical protein